jgi:hypothetical protein
MRECWWGPDTTVAAPDQVNMRAGMVIGRLLVRA